jgi:hypothetical protein
MPMEAYEPYHKDEIIEDEEKEDEHEEVVENVFTPINKPRSKVPIVDSDNTKGEPRRTLPQSPEILSSTPLIDWMSPKVSAAAIRRECASRVPSIHIPSRLLAKEVKSKYGSILMELDKEQRVGQEAPVRDSAESTEVSIVEESTWELQEKSETGEEPGVEYHGKKATLKQYSRRTLR